MIPQRNVHIGIIRRVEVISRRAGHRFFASSSSLLQQQGPAKCEPDNENQQAIRDLVAFVVCKVESNKTVH